MSPLFIQFSHLFKAFGLITLFEDISLGIHHGDIFALIGANGSGKSTLLHLLRGAIAPDAGDFTRAAGLTIGYLPQEVVIEEEIRDYLDPCRSLEAQMAACLADERLDAWAALHEAYEALGGYRRLPLEKVLKGLKLETLDLQQNALSSGEKVRLGLAKALIANPDLLLLDEPTNHLDGEMLAWLKETLRKREGATVIVSHNRKFLNETCNRLIELKEGKLACYGGSYDFYLEEKRRQLEREIKAYDAQEEERSALKEKIKAATFAKKKPPPPKDKNVMAYDKRGERHQKSVQNRLDQMKGRLAEIEAHPLVHPKPKSIKGMRFAPAPLSSSLAIELEEIGKAFGEKALFTQFNLRLCKGDRLILTGPNGAGKTTLLKIILGLVAPDQGQIRYASQAKIGYLDQEGELLPMEQTPLEYFEKRFRLNEEALRRELHMAAIGGAELLSRPFATLSAGQRKRFCLLALILDKPNVLLLDEPTNHLDFLTLEAFEEALLSFEGALMAVSHDETFIEKIATNVISLNKRAAD